MNVHRIHSPIHTSLPSKPAAAQAEKPFDEHLAQKAAFVSNASSDKQKPVLTQSEKAYFEQLYPASAEAVRAYNPYQRDGAQGTTALGSHVDRKG